MENRNQVFLSKNGQQMPIQEIPLGDREQGERSQKPTLSAAGTRQWTRSQTNRYALLLSSIVTHRKDK